MSRRLLVGVMLVALVAAVGIAWVVGGGGTSYATPAPHGDLLLDWETSDNTDVAVGKVDGGCRSFSAGDIVKIDVVAVDAVDWGAMDFLFEYPSPMQVERPGPGDGILDANFDADAGFDFVPFDGVNFFGANNFMNGAGSAMDYTTTEVTPDGSSPHGISMFDNALVTASESGSGGMARLTLDTMTLAAGVHTLSLGTDQIFAGGAHSDASGFLPDNFGSAEIAIGQPCPGTATLLSISVSPASTTISFADNVFYTATGTFDNFPTGDLTTSATWASSDESVALIDPLGQASGVGNGTTTITATQDGVTGSATLTVTGGATPTPTPTTTVAAATATPTPPAGGLPDSGTEPPGDAGSRWLVALFIAIGVTAVLGAAGAVSWRLRQRVSNK